MKPPTKIRRRAVSDRPESQVELRPLSSESSIPTLVEPKVAGLSLAGWANRETVDELLARHRALLFRGFAPARDGDFEAFVRRCSQGPLLEYKDRTTPRETRGTNIYTSTVYPPEETIALHNEGTYWIRWGLKLWFCCHVAPTTGGATPIADVRRVYDRIDPAIRDEFEQRQMMLVRNYNDGFGMTWQVVFQTEDRGEVERYFRDNDIEWEWKSGDRLRTRSIRPAVRVHPSSGEKVWFNHMAFFHVSSLPSEVRETLVRDLGEEGLPYNTYYGDGERIDPDVVAQVREAYAAEKTRFSWQAGDVMLLDNMSVAHAREPFTGDREVLVAMTEAHGDEAAA